MARKPDRVSYREELVEAISSLFPPQWFSQFSAHGNAEWTAQKIFWVSVLMSWQPQVTLGEQFRFAVELLQKIHPRWTLATALSGFLEARLKLLEVMREPMILRMQKMVAEHSEAWRVCGWLLFGVDGSRFEACRTTDNENGLGCAGKERTTPQVFQTTLLHIGTGLVWDFRLGPGTDSERHHLNAMQESLPSQSLLTADAGFISFDLCRWLLNRHCSFLLRVGSNVHLLKGLYGELEVDGSTVYLWPQQQRHLPPVVLRLIVVQRDGYRPIYLVTNVEESRLSAHHAMEIYKRRWELEVHYRTQKQTLGHAHLQSRTADMTLAEQTWHVIATWVLQLITTRELIAAGKAPASWSAAKSRDATRTLMRKALAGGFSDPTKSYRNTLKNASRDDYPRLHPKQKRQWPRKKSEKPPGPPNIRPASKKEQKRVQGLRASEYKES